MMLNPEELLRQPVPPDLTLAEFKKLMVTLDWWKALVAQFPGSSVRFQRGSMPVPDTMTVGEFRALPDHVIVMDIKDGGGGRRIKPKTPELVG